MPLILVRKKWTGLRNIDEPLEILGFFAIRRKSRQPEGFHSVEIHAGFDEPLESVKRREVILQLPKIIFVIAAEDVCHLPACRADLETV
jgi:hypothetical protein